MSPQRGTSGQRSPQGCLPLTQRPRQVWMLLLCDLRQSAPCLGPQPPPQPALAGENGGQRGEGRDHGQHETTGQQRTLPCGAGSPFSWQGVEGGRKREDTPITSPPRGLALHHGLPQAQGRHPHRGLRQGLGLGLRWRQRCGQAAGAGVIWNRQSMESLGSSRAGSHFPPVPT